MNKTETLQAVARYADDLAGRHPEVLYVYAFGPFLRDQEGPVNLIVILSECEAEGDARLPIYAPKDFPGPTRVFPYLDDELFDLVREENGFIRNALKEASLVYDRDDPTIVRFLKNPEIANS